MAGGCLIAQGFDLGYGVKPALWIAGCLCLGARPVSRQIRFERGDTFAVGFASGGHWLCVAIGFLGAMA